MNYNAVEMKRIGVDPSGWKWFNNDYSRYQVMDPSPITYELKEVTRAKPGRLIGFIAAFCAVVALLGLLNPGVQSIFTNIMNLLGFIGVAALCMNRRRWVKAIGFLLLAPFVLFVFAMFFTGRLPAYFPILLFIVSPFLLLDLWEGSLYSDSKLIERKNRLTGAELWSNPAERVYGNPGGVASAVAKFGKEAVDAGVEGENRTASLLWLLLKIPGVTVFHGLKFPNSKKADVDHAVLHGSNVYLIDSKQYRWGEYEWRTHPKYGEQIARTDGYGRPKDNHMGAAAEGYRKMLGNSVNVIPIIIVHGNKVKIGANKWSQSGVALFTPEEAMVFMGSTISHDIRAWRDNMYAREVLMKNIKA